MQVHTTQLSDTRVKLTLQADQALLEEVRNQTLQRLARGVKVQGFRPGKAPLAVVEKHIDPARYQSEFLDAALNRMYGEALTAEKLRPVAQPKVELKKFVPFTDVEFEAEVPVVGKVDLADYKNVTVARKGVSVKDEDVDAVLNNLQTRMAEKKEVERASKDGDELWIDFVGRDAKTDEPIKGGDGKNYPLVLGSNTFIPGFEENLVGLKPGEEKEFTLTFPKDYGVKALQGRKVTFKTTVNQVKEVVKPVVDDEFAAKVGPFKSADELKQNVREQLETEQQQQADREYESDLLSKITEQSKVSVPDELVDEELTRLEQEERQNVMYRGQTWQEHLEAEGVSEEEHRTNNRPGAEMRVKAGLVLAEIAEKEQVQITPEELDLRIQLLKGQYTDQAMQAELDKPENRREIASRLLSEKTIAQLVNYASQVEGGGKKKATATAKK
ncbi:MAG TPA: trigger factor [Candidatus Limnocylindrales bacterium]|nr:trigger factor [Candidatus Limnocylindrales bacterium]